MGRRYNIPLHTARLVSCCYMIASLLGATVADGHPGKDGREVLDKLLPSLKHLLSPTGSFFLVTMRANKPEGTVAFGYLTLADEDRDLLTAGRRRLHEQGITSLTLPVADLTHL